MTILVTGSNGLLGQHLCAQLISSGHQVVGIGRGANRLTQLQSLRYEEVDITDGVHLQTVVKKVSPECIVHAAAMTQVDQCEEDKQSCYNINVSATRFLIDVAIELGCRLVYISTDFVFDGLGGPYSEEDEPAPVNYYGSTKLAAEKAVMESGLQWSIVRTVLVYGEVLEGTRSNIIKWVKENLEQGKPIKVVSDQYRTPTFIDDLADGIVRVVEKKAEGIYHISGGEGLSPYDMALKTAAFYKLNASLIEKVDASTFQQIGKRPLRTGFDISKARRELGFEPRSFDDSLQLLQKQGTR